MPNCRYCSSLTAIAGVGAHCVWKISSRNSNPGLRVDVGGQTASASRDSSSYCPISLTTARFRADSVWAGGSLFRVRPDGPGTANLPFHVFGCAPPIATDVLDSISLSS